MTDIIFIAWGIVSIAISPLLFSAITFPLYKLHGGKGNIISYTKSFYKGK